MITSIFQMGKRLSKLTKVTPLGDLSPGWLAAESCPLILRLSPDALGAHWGRVLSRM